MENLPGRGWSHLLCLCEFAWEIVRDSLMVNFVPQTMNKHMKMPLGQGVWKSRKPESGIGTGMEAGTGTGTGNGNGTGKVM